MADHMARAVELQTRAQDETARIIDELRLYGSEVKGKLKRDELINPQEFYNYLRFLHEMLTGLLSLQDRLSRITGIAAREHEQMKKDLDDVEQHIEARLEAERDAMILRQIREGSIFSDDVEELAGQIHEEGEIAATRDYLERARATIRRAKDLEQEIAWMEQNRN